MLKMNGSNSANSEVIPPSDGGGNQSPNISQKDTGMLKIFRPIWRNLTSLVSSADDSSNQPTPPLPPSASAQQSGAGAQATRGQQCFHSSPPSLCSSSRNRLVRSKAVSSPDVRTEDEQCPFIFQRVKMDTQESADDFLLVVDSPALERHSDISNTPGDCSSNGAAVRPDIDGCRFSQDCLCQVCKPTRACDSEDCRRSECSNSLYSLPDFSVCSESSHSGCDERVEADGSRCSSHQATQSSMLQGSSQLSEQQDTMQTNIEQDSSASQFSVEQDTVTSRSQQDTASINPPQISIEHEAECLNASPSPSHQPQCSTPNGEGGEGGEGGDRPRYHTYSGAKPSYLLKKKFEINRAHSEPNRTDIVLVDSLTAILDTFQASDSQCCASLPVGTTTISSSSNSSSSGGGGGGDNEELNCREEELKAVVHSNCCKFIEWCDWDLLLPRLVEQDLLDEHTTHKLMSPHYSRTQKGTFFILTVLPSKGSDAFTRFCKCVSEEKQHRGHLCLQELFCS